MVQVLVVDDHQVLVDGIRALLSDVPDITVAASAGSGEEALEQMERRPVDVVLLDIGLPGMDGITTCGRIMSAWPRTRVIALSMHDGHHMISLMLENGAKGYLMKDVGRDELLDAIRTVHGGGTFLSRHATEVVVAGLREPTHQGAAPPDRELTEREREVLGLIADERTTTEIADALKISVNTVETHRRHLLEKLGVRNSAGLVRVALREGLLDR